MADEAQTTIRSINWREVFPFTNLFKSFRVAVHPSKLVLALAALLLLYTGGRILDGLWAKKHLVQPGDGPAGMMQAGADRLRPLIDRGRISRNSVEQLLDVFARQSATSAERDEARQQLIAAGLPVDTLKPRGIFITFFDYEVHQVNAVTQGVLAGNFFGGNLAAIYNFLVTGPSWLLYYHPFYFLLFAIWFMIIWSVFGGAIARIAAVHIARDEKISVRHAVRFSGNKLLSFVFAPLIPLLILLIIAAVIALVSWILFHVPYVGPIAASLVFFLALIAGLVMALVLLGLVGGFNLMYPTIAVEGSDSFDAISRSFSYVFARPWRMAFYTLVAIVYGALTYLFVRFFIWLVLALTHFAVTWWFSHTSHAADVFPAIWPGPTSSFTDPLVYGPQAGSLNWGEKTAAAIISFWVYLVIGLLGAYAISYYFSANAIIYYLMRREVDATELEDVYVEETEEEFASDTAAAPAGTAGTPAATNVVTGDSPTIITTPVTERPAPSEPSTSAPGGGVTGTAGSADPGNGPPSQDYTSNKTDAPDRPPESSV
jgi:hypothetical protein